MIEQNLELNEAASAKLLCLGLCTIANREGTATFTKPISYLAALSSLSVATVKRRLPDLERLGIIRVERFKLRQSNRYTLLTTADSSQRANDSSRTHGHREPLPKERKNGRTLSEHSKEHVAADAPDVLSQLSKRERQVVNLYHQECPLSKGFLKVNQVTDDLVKAIAVFMDADDERLREIFRGARCEPRTKSNRTLVRVLWRAYEE